MMLALMEEAAMPTKTLYVTDEDATIWEEARALGAGSDDSMSRTVIEGLRALLRERRDDSDQADEKSDLSVTVPQPQYTTLINRYRQDLRTYGWERVSLSMTKACFKEGAARTRAKLKADEARGAADRSDAARKANLSRGPEGRSEAARKANVTRAERQVRKG
jgi:hypothetical protein